MSLSTRLFALALVSTIAACSSSNADGEGTRAENGNGATAPPAEAGPRPTDPAGEDTVDESDPPTGVLLGVNPGRGQVSPFASFEDWLGRDVDIIGDALPRSSWATIEDPSDALRPWKTSRFRDYLLMLTVPLLPADGAQLEQGARGDYDVHFERLGRRLVELGDEDAILRLGHEANAEWFPWAAEENPDAYVRYWRRVAEILDATPGSDFKFDWSVARGSQRIDADRIYPGDEHVDFIGMDIYDRDPEHTPDDGSEWYVKRWNKFLTQDFGLNWLVDFANEHGKPISVTEWGLVSTQSRGHVAGDDNAFFVERMYEWMHDNDVAYAVYFEVDADDGAHRLLGRWFPDASERFRELWAGDAT